MYTITRNCRGYITMVSYKEEQTIADFEQLTKELDGFATNKKLFLLTDLREAKLCFNPEEVYKMGEIERNYGPQNLSIVEAVICRSPLEKALTAFYNSVKMGGDYTLKIFAEEDKAFKWLKSYRDYAPTF